MERLRFVDDVFAAELAYRNARSALAALMNVPGLDASFDVVDPLPIGPVAPPSIEPGTVTPVETAAIGAQGPQLAIEALTRRSDVLASRQEIARAQSATRLQRALRTPNPTVGAGYVRDFGVNAIAFGVTLPLPLFNRNQGDIQRADAELRQAERLAEATSVRARLETGLAEINRRGLFPYTLAMSIGMVHRQADALASLNDLLAAADAQMYEIKRNKRKS